MALSLTLLSLLILVPAIALARVAFLFFGECAASKSQASPAKPADSCGTGKKGRSDCASLRLLLCAIFQRASKRRAAASAKPGCSAIRWSAFVCWLILATAANSHASTVITGTLTVTNASNINATNAYTITVNADARTWTNSVVTPATQILADTDNADAINNLIAHYALYPVTGLQFFPSGTTGVSWRAAADAALTITLSTNTWGAVTYSTNTISVPATVVRDYTHSALTAHSAVTNFVATFVERTSPDPVYRTITAVADVFFLQSTNRPSDATTIRQVVIRIDPNGTNRNLGFNSSWNFVGVKPTSLVSTNVGILSLIAFGSAETDVWARYNAEFDTTDTDDQTAAEVPYTPAGAIAATDVQAALTELDTEKEPAITDSASLRSTISDESGTGAAIFADGAIGAATATTASANDNDTSVATTAYVQTEIADILDGGDTWTGTYDFGGASSLEVPNAAAPTVDAFGEIAGDNNLWDTGRGALLHYDGTAATALVGVLVSDTPSNGQVAKWNTGGTITWEDDSTGAPGSGDDVFVNGGAITHPDIDDGMDISWAITASTNLTASFARTAAIGSDPALSANHVTIGTTGIVAEGSTADTIETLLTFEDPAGSDKTWTIPNATDTAVGKTTTDTFTNKTLDAAATGNVLKQAKYLTFIRPDYGDGAGAVPQTNTFTASGLMHYTFSGTAETNVNWVVYEAAVPPDIDTSVAMTATYAFVSGGTDADDVTFHITYALGASGAALTTGTGISTSPIVMTVTPTTPASGDVQTTAAVTLTGWAGSMTAGTPLQIRVARLNTANDDTARELYLRIAYGSTQ
jgi:hypothetical protein